MSTTIFVSFPVRISEELLPDFLKFAKKKGIQCLEPFTESSHLDYKTDWDSTLTVLRFKDTAKFDINDRELSKYLDRPARKGTMFVKMRYGSSGYDTRFSFYHMANDGVVTCFGDYDTEQEYFNNDFMALAKGIERTCWDHMGKGYPQPPKGTKPAKAKK